MKRIRENYHWVIAFLAFFEMILFGGLLNSVAVFLIPISEALDVARGSYSLAMIPYSIVCTFSTMLSGVLFHKFGYKRSVMIGLGFSVLSLILTAVCKTLTGFCISKIFLGFGYGVCFTAGAVRIVKDWFFKYQGLIFGAVSMSSGLGGSLLTVLLTKIIESYGWRIANVFLALMFGVTALAFLMFMKDRPEELGLRPYGFGISAKSRTKAKDADWPGLSFAEWLHRPLFYITVISTLACCISILLTARIILPHLQDQGFSSQEAAKYQSVNMLVLAAAKLLCGAATDRLGPKPVSIFCIACAALGQAILIANADPVACYFGIILCGIGICMTSIMIPLLVPSLFGYQAFSSINSVTLAMSSMANIFSDPIANTSFDRLGTYSPVFMVAAIANACFVPVFLLIFAISKKEKKRQIRAM